MRRRTPWICCGARRPGGRHGGGHVQGATARTGLKAYPLTLAEERGHVEACSSALAAYGTSVRRAIEQADTRGDTDTADSCTEISRGIDKYLWLVEAHLG
jgi:starvation-inducible DNA-binding protein